MVDRMAVQSPQEFDELLRLRAELSYADWKAHPRFTRERLLRDAQRRWGVPGEEVLFWSGLLPTTEASLGDEPDEPDALVTLEGRRA